LCDAHQHLNLNYNDIFDKKLISLTVPAFGGCVHPR
jgi:hypothetical protein